MVFEVGLCTTSAIEEGRKMIELSYGPSIRGGLCVLGMRVLSFYATGQSIPVLHLGKDRL